MKNNDKNKPITRSQTKKLNKKSKKINKKILEEWEETESMKDQEVH